MAGKLIYKKILLWVGCLIILAAAFIISYQLFNQKSHPSLPLPPQSILQKGDWIFRSGIDYDSTLIKYLSNSPYSHIGMIVETEPNIIIAHATTNDDPNQPNQVLLSSLADFMAYDKANAIAIARPKFLTSEQNQQIAQYVKQQKGRKFILNSHNKQPFYCTLLILEGIQQKQANFNPQWQYVDIAFFGGNYLFPEAFLQQDLEWIYQVSHQ